ncbi:protein lifeguard 3-like isoform X2 [Silurus meridionalis]|uniref:protein lifeguard 3-like isoform X2 n=1 Tax=Silurus meridionalis TaxID=175797 RepID=UPI001EEC19BB|nr:protein lifeguard 3-like isoform X2 [Silurus meridionalis]
MFMSELLPSYEESQHQGSSSPPPPHTYTTPEMPGAEAGAETGAEAGAGVPPLGTSSLIPLNMSSGDIDDPSALWENRSIRHAFIRKVYLILALQLLVTTSIVAVFTFIDPVRLFIIRKPVVYLLSLIVFPIIYGLSVIDVMRRRFPVNLVYLFIFTLAMSLSAGSISSYFETKTVFLFMVMMVVVCVAITVFSFQTKVDFTSRPGLFWVLYIVLLITGIITAIILSLQYIKWLPMLYNVFGVVFCTRFLLYNTWLLLEKRIYELKPEEYLFGALTLYTITPTFWFLMRDTNCLSV